MDSSDQDRPVRVYATQEEMRSAPRSYTGEQARMIREAVRRRRDLPEQPLTLADEDRQRGR